MARRRRKKSHGFILVLVELILGIIILIGLFGVGAYFLCPLKKVAVEGTDLYTSQEIEEYILDDEYSGNAMYAFIKNKLFICIYINFSKI